tara:strand:- start:33651 stop:34226 length:576 start_codon:yes stop_codon:yes gene_type:complete
MDTPAKIVDGLLVLQYQAGNKKALSLLVKRWHLKLCKQAFWYTNDQDVAKDIVQDCWSIILKKIAGLKDTNSFGSWALTIVNRKAIDWLRKEKNADKKLQSYYNDSKISYDAIENNTTGTNEAIFTNPDTTNIVKSAIEKLPKNQQIIIKMFYLEAYKMNEISTILGVSVGTVKSRLFYAREKLKSQIKIR